KKTWPGFATGSMTTGLKQWPPASGPTIRSPSGSTSSATPAPPPPPASTSSTPPCPPTEPANGDPLEPSSPRVLRARHDAERALADSQARLDEASRRHWGRHDRDAIAAAQGRVAYNQ